MRPAGLAAAASADEPPTSSRARKVSMGWRKRSCAAPAAQPANMSAANVGSGTSSAFGTAIARSSAPRAALAALARAACLFVLKMKYSFTL
eukprot:scaffold48224_cov26-Tisochrysis_lutea.AAC.1